ncbi:MAG: cupin domain-containing protein [Alphaproteobacteria bacterium]|nr:cupin domain-containing protein [Alphaproteobacteria bacterium]
MKDDERALSPAGADFVSGSGIPIEPVTAIEGAAEAGNLGIKPLMVGDNVLLMEAHREKGLVDPEHAHNDHESICYLVRGRMRVVIGGKEFIAQPGDVWRHRLGGSHYHEALEDSLQIEIKSPARKTWD